MSPIIERRDFLRRAGQGALLLATGALTGCGGSGSGSPSASRTPTRFEVRLVTSSDPARWGRTSDDYAGWWQYRIGRIGAINNRGDVVTGIGREYGDLKTAALYRNGATTTVGVSVASDVAFPSETVLDLNNRGQLLVQQSPYDASGTFTGSRYYLSENGVTQPVALPYEKYPYPVVLGMNNASHIVGSVSITGNGGDQRPFIWRDGTLILFGDQDCGVTDINDVGQMIGSIYPRKITDTTYSQAQFVLWHDTKNYTELSPLVTGGVRSARLGEDGTVLATPGSTDAQTTTFLWIPAQANGATGIAYPIAGLPDGFVSADMNAQRDFVGSTTNLQANPNRAYRVSKEGRVVEDLNTLIPANSGWVLQNAYGINDAGFITGIGYFTNTAGLEEHGLFLLVPTAY